MQFHYDVTKRNLSDVCQHFKLVYIVSFPDQKDGIENHNNEPMK